MARKGVVNLRNVANAILADYGVLVKETVDAEAEKVAKTAAKELRRANMAIRPGPYAKDWSAKQERFSRLGTMWIVYNKAHYQLAHLLENAHDFATRTEKSGYLKIGYWEGESVIKDVESSAQTQFYEAVIRALEEAGASPSKETATNPF